MANNLTLVASPSFVTSQLGFGQALSLNGTTQWATCADGSGFNPSATTSWSVEGWFYPTSSPNTYAIAAGRTAAATSDWGFGLHQATSTHYKATLFMAGIAGGAFTDGSADVSQNVWHHMRLAVFYTGSSHVARLFVDGVLAVKISGTWNPASVSPTNYVGGWSTGTTLWYGRIDDVSPLTVDLSGNSDSTFVPLQLPSPSSRTGQVSKWPMDNNGNDVNGTLYIAQPTITSVGRTQVVLAVTAAVGGTAPYTYQWYRSTTSGFTPGAGNIVSGATSLTLTDTGLTAGTLYFYKMVATDNVSATATSTELPVSTTAQTDLVVGFIGTSVSAIAQPGTPETVPQYMQDNLKTLLGGAVNVTISNQAVSGTRTDEWLPSALWGPSGAVGSTATNNYNTAKAAFVAAGVTHICIEHGTNDARIYNAGTTYPQHLTTNSQATYQANLSTIITQLKSDFPGVPIMCNGPHGFLLISGSNTEAGLDLVHAGASGYQQAISNLVDNVAVFAGDMTSVQEFADTGGYFYSGDGAGVHPSATGAPVLGALWAVAFRQNVLKIGGGVAHRRAWN